MSLVALPQPIIIPQIAAYLAATRSALLINDDTDELAFIIQIPKTGTLTRLLIGTGSVLTTGENNVPVRIETDDKIGTIEIGRDRIISWAISDQKGKTAYFQDSNEELVLRKLF